MNPQRWRQIEEIYHAALEREGDQRAAFLQQACADDEELRREVESLLAHEATTKGFMESPALEVAAQALAQEGSPTLLGRQLGHYHVLSQIGAGGMGEVYRAKDTKLRREVALKVLPAALAGDSERLARFRREAQLLASLQHENIAAIYGLEDFDGIQFIAMELVEGETLAEQVVRGPMAVKESLGICQQVAAALEHAHEKGIVHRDLKPANVKLTPQGKVKVLDFGLAKAFTGAAGQSFDLPTISMERTEKGRILGTPAYMSPEQARGQEVDKRTDIWAFGCVLYELITGQPAFRGETVSDTLVRVLEREPDWQALPTSLPEKIRDLLRRCLQKEKERRLRDIGDARIEMEELLSAREATSRPVPIRLVPVWGHLFVALGLLSVVGLLLTGLLGGLRDRLLERTALVPIQSLAVLPLQNFSGDPEQEYFVDGMTEALTADLSKIGALKVISRTSAMQYKGTKKPLPEIARELNVDAVVEGSVTRAGQRVRITAQLIRAATDTHLWAESYERDLQDVLRLQSEVAQAIARQIQIAVTPEQQAQLTAKRAVNPEAYEAYLKGMFYLNKFTPEGFEKGLAYLQQAIDKDPADPMAYAGLALGYSLIGHDRFPDAFTRAKAAARKAEELGEPLGETYLALGQIEFYSDWDFAAAERDLRRAVALNPSLAQAHRHYSWYLYLTGRTDEALAEMRRAQELEPLTPVFPADVGWQYQLLGQADKAIEQARKALELNPNFAEALTVLGYAYLDKGMFEEAIRWHEKAAAADRGWRWPLGRTLALAGRKEEARKLAAELAKKPTPMDDRGLAEIYISLGDKDEAFRWLEAGYKARFSWMPFIQSNPRFAPLRDDPRFQDLARRIGLPP